MLAISDFGSGMSMIRLALATLVLSAGATAAAPAAKAAVLSISGTGFIQQCPCPPSGNGPDVEKGVLKPTDQSTVYAAIDFPNTTDKICSFSLIYHDINNAETMTARLFRKAFAVGGNPFNNPAVIATVSSAAGVPNTVRKATTTTISSPTINENSGFYFVQVSGLNFNLNLLGVQIDHRQSCPAS